jgi:hypothetical protein
LVIGLAIYPGSKALGNCQDYWTPEYKAMMGCGGNSPQQRAPVYNGPSPQQIAAQQAAAQAAAEAAAKEAQRQAILRQAHQANDVGRSFWNRHEWGAAVQSFREALAKSPGDKVIQSNLAKATEQLRQEQWQQTLKQEDANTASQMGATLHRLTEAMPDFDGHNTTSAPPSGTSAGLDFLPATSAAPTSAAVGNQSNASAVQSQPTPWQDPNVVDLRGTTKTAVDPVAMKGSGTNVSSSFRKNAPPPPAPGVELPQNQDIELSGTAPSKPKSAWPGEQRPANKPKLINPLDEEERTKELAKAVFENPATEDLMLKGMMEGAGEVPTAPVARSGPTAVPAGVLHSEQSAGPNN